MTGDAELGTFLLGISPLSLFFTGLEASGALSRGVEAAACINGP